MTTKSDHVKEWRRNTKLKLITCMGSKCQICSYSKSVSALEFHHLNPEEKDFGLGTSRANPKNWDAIVDEVKKCILLCSNCHREVHDGTSQIPEKYQEFDKSILERIENKYLTKKAEITYCPICNKIKENQNKTCSLSCAAKVSLKFDWESIDVIDLIENQKMSRNKIAELLRMF